MRYDVRTYPYPFSWTSAQPYGIWDMLLGTWAEELSEFVTTDHEEAAECAARWNSIEAAHGEEQPCSPEPDARVVALLPCGCPAVSPAYPRDYPLGHPHWACLRSEDQAYAEREMWDVRQSWPGGRSYEAWQAAD